MTAAEMKAKYDGYKVPNRLEIPTLPFCEVLDFAEYWLDLHDVMKQTDISIELLSRMLDHYKETIELERMLQDNEDI